MKRIQKRLQHAKKRAMRKMPSNPKITEAMQKQREGKHDRPRDPDAGAYDSPFTGKEAAERYEMEAVKRHLGREPRDRQEYLEVCKKLGLK